MKAYKYWHLIGELNAALDTGRYDGITNAEVHQHCDAGTIGQFLVDRLGDCCDFSIIESADWNDLAEEWQRLENAVDEKRKMGLEHRGLCLLLAYAAYSVRMRLPADVWQLDDPDDRPEPT